MPGLKVLVNGIVAYAALTVDLHIAQLKMVTMVRCIITGSSVVAGREACKFVSTHKQARFFLPVAWQLLASLSWLVASALQTSKCRASEQRCGLWDGRCSEPTPDVPNWFALNM